MIKCAETADVPLANGVIVNAAGLPAGFLTVNTELIVVGPGGPGEELQTEDNYNIHYFLYI